MSEPFDNTVWLQSLLDNPRNEIKLIGAYLKKYKKMHFTTKAVADAELRRNLRTAKFLVENYTPPQIRTGILYCIREYVDKWTLETVSSKLPTVLAQPESNNPLL